MPLLLELLRSRERRASLSKTLTEKPSDYLISKARLSCSIFGQRGVCHVGPRSRTWLKQRRYRARGLRIVGITYPPEQESEVRGFSRKLKINYPLIIGSKETKQIFTASETLPLTVIIDREGNIRELIEGIMYPDEFGEKVKPLLSYRG